MPQSFVEAVQELDVPDPRPEPVSQMIDHTADQVNLYSGSPIHQIMADLVFSEDNRIVDGKV